MPTFRHLASALAIAAAVALAACGGVAQDDPAPAAAPAADARRGFSEASARAVADVAGGRANLLDVRTRAEFDDAHARGARLLPLDRLERGELPALASGRPLYVYCATGRRAARAVAILREAGYDDVTNIGGLGDWEAAGGPVT